MNKALEFFQRRPFSSDVVLAYIRTKKLNAALIGLLFLATLGCSAPDATPVPTSTTVDAAIQTALPVPAATPTPYPTYTPYPTPAYTVPIFDEEEVERRVFEELYLCPAAVERGQQGIAYSMTTSWQEHQFDTTYIGRDEWLVSASWPSGYFGEWKLNERTGTVTAYGGSNAGEHALSWSLDCSESVYELYGR